MNVISFIIVALFIIYPSSAPGASWDYSKHSIPVEDIEAGGPAKDAIPALSSPVFIKAADADFMRDDEQVLGVYHNHVARAYPTKILSWHEVVNDRFGNDPVLVSWCPLAFSGVAYSRTIQGEEYQFGVSGLLYRSNLLMYDHKTESLWSQVLEKAVAGPQTDTKLAVIPSTLTTWRTWKKNHPDTEVLSPETGHKRNYSIDPYEDYYRAEKGLQSFFEPGPGEVEKEIVAGVVIDGSAKAYPVEELRKNRITDTLAGKEVTLTFDPYTDEIRVQNEGKSIPFVAVYWFVWKGIYAGSDLYGR